METQHPGLSGRLLKKSEDQSFQQPVKAALVLGLILTAGVFAACDRDKQKVAGAGDTARQAGAAPVGLCPDFDAAKPRPVWKDMEGWIPYKESGCRNMEPFWKDVLINGKRTDLKGCNFFVLGAPMKDAAYSSHFASESPYYQTFFGTYIIPPAADGKKIPYDAIETLGRRDIGAWVAAFGGNPETKLTSSEKKCIEPAGVTDPDNPKCVKWEIQATVGSFTDTGVRNPQQGLPPLLIVPKDAWDKNTDSYQTANYIPIRNVIWYLENGTQVVTYQNGIEFTDKSGKPVATSRAVLEQMDIMHASIKVDDPNSPYYCPPEPVGPPPGA